MNKDILSKAYRLISLSRFMSKLFEKEKNTTSKYVHATSKGHEIIQIAMGLQLCNFDYLYPYYRDDSILLSIGLQPYDLILQLLAKSKDPFSGGKTYYSHPSLNDKNLPKIPHQSSATGMQAIPATGAAMGLLYKEQVGLSNDHKPIVVCSLGDASCTEGEVSEAFQMAVLKKLPIIYLVQDNEWDISAKAEETRSQDISFYSKGFKGLHSFSIDGTNFEESYLTVKKALKITRNRVGPVMIHAKVPLLNHHTSGVRMEWYRDDIEEHILRDPYPKLKQLLLENNFTEEQLLEISNQSETLVNQHYKDALKEKEPNVDELYQHIFAPTKVIKENGNRSPSNKEPTVMVDSALFAIREILVSDKRCLLYGQDVGARLGGVFREAATLAQQFGDHRVFNTPIQEAFIIGSTAGMSAVGLKPIVEVQFADYIWPGLNQLFTEISRSYYLSNGKWPISMILRVPIGAYGSGGPYHSSSIESIVTNIIGIKVVYPSTGADLKGLIKAAYLDPNPVLILEHKGLYWSKIPGTEGARTIEPDSDYIIPIGNARIVLKADNSFVNSGISVVVISYGRGIYWALEAAKFYNGQIEVLDLRTLNPLDEKQIFKLSKLHGKVLIVTEEPNSSSFSLGLAGKIQKNCFEYLDAPVEIVGSENTPAIPLNENLEYAYLPNAQKIKKILSKLLEY
ncbi:MAG: tungsten formylmethanofuran dehydrogenase [Crocinitomicaceae bacterium]|nr:tungsten formylmethanofuran dehydrogenase [Crocinitomicaceae bacterium]